MKFQYTLILRFNSDDRRHSEGIFPSQIHTPIQFVYEKMFGTTPPKLLLRKVWIR